MGNSEMINANKDIGWFWCKLSANLPLYNVSRIAGLGGKKEPGIVKNEELVTLDILYHSDIQ